MNLIKRIPLILLIALAVLALAGCGPVKGTLVMGDTYRLESGQTLNDDLTVMGGVAELENDSTVNGDISVLGGTLRVGGKINGDISVMGGSVALGETAEVSGDVTQIGGSVSKAEGAVVDGTYGKKGSTISVPRAPVMGVHSLDPILSPFMAFFQALAIAAMAVLVYLFAARPMERVGQAVMAQPVISGFIGLLTVVVVPALLLILLITIILSPITLLGFLLAGIAWIFGWVALGLVTGKHIARAFNQTWSDPLSAGIGALVLSLVASLFNIIIPCVGWIPGFLAGIVGLGAVVATRFGTQDYNSSNPAGYNFNRTAPRPVPPQPPYTPAPPSQYSAPAQQPMPDVPPAPTASPTTDFFGTEGPTNATFVQDDEIPGEERPAAKPDDRQE